MITQRTASSFLAACLRHAASVSRLTVVRRSAASTSAKAAASPARILANGGVLEVFGIDNHDSADLVSKMIDENTVDYRLEGWSTNYSKELSGGTIHCSTVSEHATTRRLFTPDEIMRLGPDRQLLLRQGQAPLLTGRIVYYRDREFAGTFDLA